MSSAPPPPAETTEEAAAPKKGGKKKLILIIAAAVVVLLLAGAGLWFTGILPHLLGMEKKSETAEAAKPAPPSYVELPELIANLNSPGHKPSYIKMSVRIEVPKPEDVEKVKAAMPRLQDLMQTYLREMRPDELRGSAGTYRLREELLLRANVAVAPARVSNVLFTQMLIQ